MADHTKEPWPEYLDVAVVMTPNPDGPDAAILSFEDYKRARACVNACAGIPTPDLEVDNATFIKMLNERAELKDALANSASREAALVEKLKVATNAMENLVKVKGRFHTALAYDGVVAALAKIKEASNGTV